MIKVGAATETALKERKHRIEDAVSATRAAVEEGIVPGGGSALVHAAAALDDGLGLKGDEATGVAIVRKALTSAAVLDRRQRRSGGLRSSPARSPSWSGASGFNAATLTYGDLMADGVIDPVKVTRSRRGQRRVDRADGAHHRERGRRQARAARAGRRGRARPRARPLATPRTPRATSPDGEVGLVGQLPVLRSAVD